MSEEEAKTTKRLRREYEFRYGIGTMLFIVASISFLLACAAISFPSEDARKNGTILPLAISGMFFVISSGIRFTPVRWFCPNPECGKRLHAKDPWICGFCDAVNRKASFLKECGNRNCGVEPRAYECPHCGTPNYLTKDHDARNAARSLNARPKPKAPVGPNETEALRLARVKELEDREHEKKKLQLEIELAQLRLKLNPPEPKKVDPRQERMDRMFGGIEDAVLDCKTLQQSFVKETQLHAEIDANPDLNPSQRHEVKEIVSRKFESLRIELGERIRV
jgi:hypothetical protein